MNDYGWPFDDLAEVDEQARQLSLTVLVMEAVGLTKLLDRYSDGAELAMSQCYHQLATGIVQKHNGQQIGNTGLKSPRPQAHVAGHVRSGSGVPVGKLATEGSYQ